MGHCKGGVCSRKCPFPNRLTDSEYKVHANPGQRLLTVSSTCYGSYFCLPALAQDLATRAADQVISRLKRR